MTFAERIFALLVLAIPIARTIVFEEVFREPRDWRRNLKSESRNRNDESMTNAQMTHRAFLSFSHSDLIRHSGFGIRHFRVAPIEANRPK